MLQLHARRFSALAAASTTVSAVTCLSSSMAFKSIRQMSCYISVMKTSVLGYTWPSMQQKRSFWSWEPPKPINTEEKRTLSVSEAMHQYRLCLLEDRDVLYRAVAEEREWRVPVHNQYQPPCENNIVLDDGVLYLDLVQPSSFLSRKNDSSSSSVLSGVCRTSTSGVAALLGLQSRYEGTVKSIVISDGNSKLVFDDECFDDLEKITATVAIEETIGSIATRAMSSFRYESHIEDLRILLKYNHFCVLEIVKNSGVPAVVFASPQGRQSFIIFTDHASALKYIEAHGKEMLKNMFEENAALSEQFNIIEVTGRDVFDLVLNNQRSVNCICFNPVGPGRSDVISTGIFVELETEALSETSI